MTKRGGIGNCLLVSCILAALPLAGQAAVQRDPRTMAEASQACEDSELGHILIWVMGGEQEASGSQPIPRGMYGEGQVFTRL